MYVIVNFLQILTPNLQQYIIIIIIFILIYRFSDFVFYIINILYSIFLILYYICDI